MRTTRSLIPILLIACSDPYNNVDDDDAATRLAMVQPVPTVAQRRAAAPTIEWPRFSSTVTLKGEGLPWDASLRVYDENNGVRLHPVSQPIGTTITSQGVTFVIKEKFSLGFIVPFGEHFADVPWESVRRFIRG